MSGGLMSTNYYCAGEGKGRLVLQGVDQSVERIFQLLRWSITETPTSSHVQRVSSEANEPLVTDKATVQGSAADTAPVVRHPKQVLSGWGEQRTMAGLETQRDTWLGVWMVRNNEPVSTL